MKRPRRAYLDKQSAPKRIRTLTPAQSIATSQLIKKELRRVTDVKYADTSGALSNITSSGTVLSLLSNLTRGDLGVNNYSGNTLVPIGVTVNFGIQTNQNYNYVRVMIFQWLDSLVPVVTGVLASTVTGIGPFANILVTNRKEIRVLSDNIMSVAPTAGGDNTVLGNGTITRKVFIPGSKLEKVRMNSSTDACQHGNICMLFISDDVLTTYPQLSWYSRVSFSD